MNWLKFGFAFLVGWSLSYLVCEPVFGRTDSPRICLTITPKITASPNQAHSVFTGIPIEVLEKIEKMDRPYYMRFNETKVFINLESEENRMAKKAKTTKPKKERKPNLKKTKPESIRTTVYIRKDTFDKLYLLSVHEDRSISWLVNKLLSEGLK